MQLIIIRHGATEWSVAGRHTGLTDLPLLADGIEQAAAAGIALRRLCGAADLERMRVFTSPLERARATAEIVFPARPLDVDPLLCEFDYGEYEGRTAAEIREQRPGWEIWNDGCPRGETVEEVGDRADSFLAGLPSGDGVFALVAHGHLIRILAARAIGLEARQGQIFAIDTATLSMIEDIRGKRVVSLWNLRPALVD